MKKNLYYILYIGILVMFLAGCQDDALFTPSGDGPAKLRYAVKVDDQLKSRAIGDSTIVNNLSVLVFNQHGQFVTRKDNLKWNDDIELELYRGYYKVLFWLQYADENMQTPYTINENGQVSVSYGGWTGNISDVEKWDAFYLVDDLIISSAVQNKSVKLTRPVGQLNWATQDEFNPEDHQVMVTLNNVATTFDPLNNTVSGNQKVSFVFNDFTEETLTTTDGETYTYLTCNYLFPDTLTATFDLQKNGTSVKNTGQIDNIVIAENMRTNVLGSIAQAPETGDGAWDGVTLEEPTQDEENRYIIDKPSKLAWLTSDENDLTEAATFLVTEDLDMESIEIASVKLPVGSTFDGDGKTIKNFANSLFGNATKLTVQNLILDNVDATSDGHVGVLVNTLIGSSSFTGVSITNSSATTSNGAAGGMIGYITNKEGETLEVTFSNCTATSNEVNGSLTSGVYVGRFRGYDDSETLTFSSCNPSSATIKGTNPYYVEGNEATWLADNDYSNYSGWLGNEEYYRGTVRFGYVDENNIGIQFIPKWDGTTKVDPLKDSNNTILIYSAFDLANLQKSSPSAVTFKKDVDLGGNKFDPIKSITNLDGENNTVYNLKVEMVHDGMGAAFIQSTPTGSSVEVSHKNLTLIGADVKNYHDTSLYPAYAITEDGGAGNAYGGIFISKANSCKSYTIENIHVKDSKLYAVCKMGGVIGQSIDTNLTMMNCSVDNCTIQNYQPNVPNYYVLGTDTEPWIKKGVYVNLLQWWYTNGEAGGLIGFLQNREAKIHGCSVKNSKINCIGQENKDVIANVYLSQPTLQNCWKNNTVLAKGKTTIAGRHVNQFIGDVVSYRASETSTDYTVSITDYTVSGNTYFDIPADETNVYNHQYDKRGDSYNTNADLYCEVVGCAYYIGLDIVFDVIIKKYNLGHMKYYAGTLNFNSLDGKTNDSFTEGIGEAENVNVAWIGGNFKITSISGKAEYPSEPTRKDPVY